MDVESLIAFLGIVALATYLQTVWGFALGMVVIGGVALLDIVSVAFAAAVISILMLVNILIALHRSYRHVRWSLAALITLSMAPAVVLGVMLLDDLGERSIARLHLLLGASILLGALLLVVHPTPRSERSSRTAALVTGAASGLLTGLFSAGGPPVVYFMYRQPDSLPSVRATLLAVLAIATLLRVAYVGVKGEIDYGVLQVTLSCLPVVLAATLIGKRFVPPLSDLNMRRAAFSLLAVVGLVLIL